MLGSFKITETCSYSTENNFEIIHCVYLPEELSKFPKFPSSLSLREASLPLKSEAFTCVIIQKNVTLEPKCSILVTCHRGEKKTSELHGLEATVLAKILWSQMLVFQACPALHSPEMPVQAHSYKVAARFQMQKNRQLN